MPISKTEATRLLKCQKTDKYSKEHPNKLEPLPTWATTPWHKPLEGPKTTSCYGLPWGTQLLLHQIATQLTCMLEFG